MAVIAGVDGRVIDNSTVIGLIRTWGISSSADIQKLVHSASKKGSARTAGNTDWTGKYTAYGHTPVKLPGDSFTFKGVVKGTGSNNVEAQGTAIIDAVEIEWDIEGGKPISHVVEFGGNGALTFVNNGTAALDAVIAAPVASIGTKLELWTVAASPAKDVEITDVRTMKLRIERPSLAYASSATSGGKRRVSGNWDANLTATVYWDDWSTLPAVNAVREVRAFVDGSTYWQMKWGILREQSGLDVDVEAPGLVGCTLTWDMQAITTVAATPTLGQIAKPGGAAVWS